MLQNVMAVTNATIPIWATQNMCQWEGKHEARAITRE
jgi:hypothetical protein